MGNSKRRLLAAATPAAAAATPPLTDATVSEEEAVVLEVLLSARACSSGTYKPERGDTPCYYCPVGSSTTAPDYAAAKSLAGCVCVAGYFATRSPPSDYDSNTNASALVAFLQSCTACPKNFFRSPKQPDSTNCTPCPPFSETSGPGSAFCDCMSGYYYYYFNGGSSSSSNNNNVTTDAATSIMACHICEAGFYCQANVRAPCPPNSVSSPGAKSRGECICNPMTHYGTLVGTDDNECILKPFAYDCIKGVGVGAAADCGCAEGWQIQQIITMSNSNEAKQRIRCVSGCLPGTYATLRPFSQAFSHCEPCPPNTYATTGDLLLECTPCPPGRFSPKGAVSIAECRCKITTAQEDNSNNSATAANINTDCAAGCAAGQYVLADACVQCPSGMSSPANSYGIGACLCPPGSFVSSTAACQPCRRGTYSHSLSATCSKCPPGFTTENFGATSLLACRPAPP